MLSVANLSRTYGATKAVDAVSFCIEQGEIVGLLGRNGAGKTTIMKMISGYLEPDHGQLIINEHDLSTQRKLAQNIIGYLPENLPIYPEMSVADYLDYAAELKGLTDNKYQEIKRVVAATEIGDKLLAPIATLSRGYKQRVGVAQAILGKPKLLILDEPTNGLDPTQTEHMRNLIRAIAQHATVILSTHIMQEVDALCDRVLIMRAGQLALDAKLSELRTSKHLLVECSLPEQAMLSLCAAISQITQVEQLRSNADAYYYQYRLHFSGQENLPLQATLAKRLIQHNASLYSLTLARRDLETVFHDIDQQGGLTREMEVEHVA